MSLRHHPSTAVLTAHASGALADGPGLVVAAHLERCAGCREAVRALEAAGGALMEALPDAPLDAQALDRALARLERPVQEQPRPRPQARRGFEESRLPRALAGRRLGARRFVGPALWIAHVHSNAPAGWRTYLLYAGKGKRLLEHGHKGAEMTAVLHGAFRDETGLYGPGDLAQAEEGQVHRPEVMAEEPCLCLVSAQGGVKTRGLGRLLQLFLQV